MAKPTTVIRIGEETHALLRELARDENKSMQELLAKALEAYRRQRFLEQMNAAYAALRSDQDLWRQEQEERRLLEGTLADDLDETHPPQTP